MVKHVQSKTPWRKSCPESAFATFSRLGQLPTTPHLHRQRRSMSTTPRIRLGVLHNADAP